MGNLIPVFVAFVLNCCGVYLFIDPKLSGCGPYVSMLIFNFAVFLLLWDVRLYPTSMRKLGTCCSNILQVSGPDAHRKLILSSHIEVFGCCDFNRTFGKRFLVTTGGRLNASPPKDRGCGRGAFKAGRVSMRHVDRVP